MESQKLLFTIIVPIYNIRDYLECCIDSILKQSYQNLEIILVDDGSTDGSAKICDLYKEQDLRVRVIHKKNGGLVSARKAGVVQASGDYVLYVDGDDWIDSSYIEYMAKKLIDYKPDLAVCLGHKKEYEDGRSIEIKTEIPTVYAERENFENQVFPYFISLDEFYSSYIPATIWCYIFKKDVLLANQRLVDENIIVGEDFACIFYCLLHVSSILICNQTFYHYRQRQRSMVHTYRDDMTCRLKKLYIDIKNAIDQSCYDHQILEKKLLYWMYFALMISDMRVLVKSQSDYLFPYQSVKKGSRVIIYGAGTFGKQLYKALENRENYTIVGWIDQGWKQYQKEGLNVQPVEAIYEMDYDNIVLAVTRQAIIQDIRLRISKIGVNPAKIAEFDKTLLTEENLPKMIKE